MNIPVSKVKAIPMEIGGGFGGKTLVYVEPVAAALARKAGRPGEGDHVTDRSV